MITMEQTIRDLCEATGHEEFDDFTYQDQLYVVAAFMREFPEGSSRYWFNRFGGKATSQEQAPSQGYPAPPQPQSAPQASPQPTQGANGDSSSETIEYIFLVVFSSVNLLLIGVPP